VLNPSLDSSCYAGLGFIARVATPQRRARAAGQLEEQNHAPFTAARLREHRRRQSPKGVSPWWQFLESRRLANGATAPGVRELQEYAARLGVHDRDYARVRAAVTEQWNKYQVWVPGLVANGIRRISLLPYLQPNAPFGAR
jgi:hypothetical protein